MAQRDQDTVLPTGRYIKQKKKLSLSVRNLHYSDRCGCWEGEFPLPLQVLLASLRINWYETDWQEKETLIITYGIHIDMRFQNQSGKMRYTCHSELRRRRYGSGLQTEGRQFTWIWKRVNVWKTNIGWAVQKQWDMERSFIKQVLLDSSLSTISSSYFTVGIYSGTAPSIGLLSKFFLGS